jgi:hypothetical protein
LSTAEEEAKQSWLGVVVARVGRFIGKKKKREWERSYYERDEREKGRIKLKIREVTLGGEWSGWNGQGHGTESV